MSLKINIVLGANTVHFDRGITKSTKQAEQKLNGFANQAKGLFEQLSRRVRTAHH